MQVADAIIVRRAGYTRNAKNHFQKITYRKKIQNEVIYSS